MKKLFLAALAALTLSACTGKTEYGTCIGAFDKENPKLVYKVSAWNVAMGVIFVETIVVPILVIVDETKCPVARVDGSLP
jgi:hypothetical protein